MIDEVDSILKYKPSISIILCTNVFDKYLQYAIQSCLNQTFQDFELIIVINGLEVDKIESDLLKYCLGYNNIKIYKTHIKHLPFSLSMGLHNASGKYIARMDADDISINNRLEIQYRYMEDNPDVIVVGSWYTIIDGDGNKVKNINLPTTDNDIRNSFFYSNPICHPSVFFRKKDIIDSGGYSFDLNAEDYTLWLRLSANKSCKFANIPEYLLLYRSFSLNGTRKNQSAYVSMACSQFRCLLITKNLIWFISIFVTLFKILLNRLNGKI